MASNNELAILYSIICEAQYECGGENEELDKFIAFLHKRLEEEIK